MIRDGTDYPCIGGPVSGQVYAIPHGTKLLKFPTERTIARDHVYELRDGRLVYIGQRHRPGF